ncbi:hypothetical protein XNC1_1148 [Xenorhabdus nematophila ATCC 19061]|uniref:Uncharacterized protein n=1 Tax=Xenorhabdus nematophila (strain ATCC 19061 / DSM 3370 / CCUG 14189 / LMG 1036 / NCIMB 9965 / AN6) TaxID=406817 RepID=D3V921_XENNA|nr:hypothetical protein XNC1_1148 [Xenorhabdus nematophila ATCC 19061]CEK22123.1 hypothetical protein XNC2_1127 [Xenorhabdus nematophila AN6/1]
MCFFSLFEVSIFIFNKIKNIFKNNNHEQDHKSNKGCFYKNKNCVFLELSIFSYLYLI